MKHQVLLFVILIYPIQLFSQIHPGLADKIAIHSIENEYLAVNVKNLGAELTSIKLKDDDTEYLWQGDSATWLDHAILQFPIIGNVRNNQYSLKGKSYEIMSHGFARVSHFELLSKSQDSITFRLESNDEIFKMYPYVFQLTATYKLSGQSIIAEFTVKNTGKNEMHFSFGFHPGFNCPIQHFQQFDDFFLEFEKNESINVMHIDPQGFVTNKKEHFLKNSNIFDINKDAFKEGAIIFLNPKSTVVSLKSKSSDKYVKLNIGEIPYLGIWSPSKGGNFLCIEPWFGIPDSKNQRLDFNHKIGIRKLPPGGEFFSAFTIEIY